MKTWNLPDGTAVPVIGQGTWRMGEDPKRRKAEIDALKMGIDLGLTLIDTAEMYGEGGSEEIVGQAINGQRDNIFLVSKFYPHHASKKALPQTLEKSLKRLNTDYLDLYLLHWRGETPLAETVETLKSLRQAGKIRHWGVSNLSLEDMQELGEASCTANQVFYNPANRGIEFDLVPWCQQHQVMIMAYSPLGHDAALLKSSALVEVAKRHNVTPAQITIAWTIRYQGMISIPKAVTPAHIQENAAAANIQLSDEDLAIIDKAFLPPNRPESLAIL
jgi:diketogulonate reductase-like aldo/keto reductase